MEMGSSGNGLFSQVSALDKKLSIFRDAPFERRRSSGRGRSGLPRAPADAESDNPDAPSADIDEKHSINITV
jgi:hypothetical protein